MPTTCAQTRRKIEIWVALLFINLKLSDVDQKIGIFHTNVHLTEIEAFLRDQISTERFRRL